jgi:hypothetical protein
MRRNRVRVWIEGNETDNETGSQAGNEKQGKNKGQKEQKDPIEERKAYILKARRQKRDNHNCLKNTYCAVCCALPCLPPSCPLPFAEDEDEADSSALASGIRRSSLSISTCAHSVGSLFASVRGRRERMSESERERYQIQYMMCVCERK